MAERISVKRAAQIMGKSEQFVRIGLQRGLLPFGTAIKGDAGSRRASYYISPGLFCNYVGISKADI